MPTIGDREQSNRLLRALEEEPEILGRRLIYQKWGRSRDPEDLLEIASIDLSKISGWPRATVLTNAKRINWTWVVQCLLQGEQAGRVSHEQVAEAIRLNYNPAKLIDFLSEDRGVSSVAVRHLVDAVRESKLEYVLSRGGRTWSGFGNWYYVERDSDASGSGPSIESNIAAAANSQFRDRVLYGGDFQEASTLENVFRCLQTPDRATVHSALTLLRGDTRSLRLMRMWGNKVIQKAVDQLVGVLIELIGTREYAASCCEILGVLRAGAALEPLERGAKASVGQEAIPFCEAIGHIGGEYAFSFFEQVIEENADLAPMAARGLAKIASPRATQLLIKLCESIPESKLYRDQLWLNFEQYDERALHRLLSEKLEVRSDLLPAWLQHHECGKQEGSWDFAVHLQGELYDPADISSADLAFAKIHFQDKLKSCPCCMQPSCYLAWRFYSRWGLRTRSIVGDHGWAVTCDRCQKVVNFFCIMSMKA